MMQWEREGGILGVLEGLCKLNITGNFKLSLLEKCLFIIIIGLFQKCIAHFRGILHTSVWVPSSVRHLRQGKISNVANRSLNVTNENETEPKE